VPRTLLVEGTKTFRITVPDGAKVTFGPWSPGGSKANNYEERQGGNNGTLRVYETKAVGASIIGVWSGVKSFRWDDLDYEEQTFVEKGSTVWQSDKYGYKRDEAVKREETWETSKPRQLVVAPAFEEEGEEEKV